MNVDELRKYFTPKNWDRLCYAVNAVNRTNWLDEVKDKFNLNNKELLYIYANRLNPEIPLPKALAAKKQAGELVDKILN